MHIKGSKNLKENNHGIIKGNNENYEERKE